METKVIDALYLYASKYAQNGSPASDTQSNFILKTITNMCLRKGFMEEAEDPRSP
jgi:hypothetical protein